MVFPQLYGDTYIHIEALTNNYGSMTSYNCLILCCILSFLGFTEEDVRFS